MYIGERNVNYCSPTHGVAILFFPVAAVFAPVWAAAHIEQRGLYSLSKPQIFHGLSKLLWLRGTFVPEIMRKLLIE
jgi:hypothetical protein